MSFDKITELRTKYNEILDLVISNCNENSDKLKMFKESYTDEDIDIIISKFCKDLENDKKIFKLFLTRNPRIFGNKISLKIIPSFSIKSILSKNNDYLWECIQLIYAIYRTGDKKNKENVESIIEAVEKYNLNPNNEECSDNSTKQKSSADNLIMDIADTLRDSMVNASKENSKVNPIENMIKTSQIISDKYGQQIQSGAFSMNEMFESLGRMMTEIDEKTSNDEELQNVKLDENIKPEDMMKDLGINTDEFNPMEMISSLLNKKKNNKELTPEQIKEMEEFYSKFSTEDFTFENTENNSNENKLSQFNNSIMSMIPDNQKDNFKKMSESLFSSDEGESIENKLSESLMSMMPDDKKEGLKNISEAILSSNEDESMENKLNESLMSMIPDDQKDNFKNISEAITSSNVDESIENKLNESLMSMIPDDQKEDFKKMTEALSSNDEESIMQMTQDLMSSVSN